MGWMGVLRCKHGQHEVFPSVKAGGSELSGSREEDRPLPSRVRRCHCEGWELRRRKGEPSSVQAHPSVPFQRPDCILSLPFCSLPRRTTAGFDAERGPSRSINKLSPAQQTFLGATLSLSLYVCLGPFSLSAVPLALFFCFFFPTGGYDEM